MVVAEANAYTLADVVRDRIEGPPKPSKDSKKASKKTVAGAASIQKPTSNLNNSAPLSQSPTKAHVDSDNTKTQLAASGDTQPQAVTAVSHPAADQSATKVPLASQPSAASVQSELDAF